MHMVTKTARKVHVAHKMIPMILILFEVSIVSDDVLVMFMTITPINATNTANN